uniref:Nbn protein n=1 Tax=Fopius arisanus TaxID=64838 RepID=A0A0C9QGH0_9HYME
MWILEDESDQRYYPSPSKPFIIGRNQGDLIAKSDGSISRSHAKIEIFSCLEKCQVTDTKSKYGTFLMDNNNQVLMQIKDVYTIQPNDRIRFGLQNCILTFIQQTFVLLTSSLTREDKEELTEIMAAINGTILEEWNDSCTHLTVSIPKLTAKLVCALAAGVSIVTIDYWRSVKKAKREGNPIPDPSKFCPVLEDSMLLKNETSLLPNPSRKSIFMDFVFIHFRKNQMDTYKKMIELSGGTSVFYGEKSFDKKLLSHSNSRVILYHDDDSQTEPYRVPDVARVKSFLKNNNRRMIPEIEITLAILSASVESCCNPSFSYENLLKNAREKKSGRGRRNISS